MVATLCDCEDKQTLMEIWKISIKTSQSEGRVSTIHYFHDRHMMAAVLMYFTACEPWWLLMGTVHSHLCCFWCAFSSLDTNGMHVLFTNSLSTISRHNSVTHLDNAAQQSRNCALDCCGIEWRSGCSSCAGRGPSSRLTHWRGWRSLGRLCPPPSPALPPAHSHLAPIKGKIMTYHHVRRNVIHLCAVCHCFSPFLANCTDILQQNYWVIIVTSWLCPTLHIKIHY